MLYMYCNQLRLQKIVEKETRIIYTDAGLDLPVPGVLKTAHVQVGILLQLNDIVCQKTFHCYIDTPTHLDLNVQYRSIVVNGVTIFDKFHLDLQRSGRSSGIVCEH